jgi:sulfate transport system permease protein
MSEARSSVLAAADAPSGKAARPARWRRQSVLPGFGPGLGYVTFYLSLLVLLPLGALVLKSVSIGPEQFWKIATDPQVTSALKLTFGAAFVAALVDTLFGFIIAWCLVRYRFPGRRLFDAAVDLPFALPTAVAGIALAALYVPQGPFGAILIQFGIKVALTPLGVVMALIFVSLPFVVRSVQPVLEDMEREAEEAAATLGAGRLRTALTVVLPGLVPAVLSGGALAFARAVGEYGSVIFLSSSIPYVSQIAPQLIIVKLDRYDYAGATVVAVVMLTMSFVALLVVNLVQTASRRWFGNV